MQNIFAIIRIGRIAQSLSSQKILNRFKEAVQKLKFFGFSVINRLIVNRIFRSYSLCEKKLKQPEKKTQKTGEYNPANNRTVCKRIT